MINNSEFHKPKYPDNFYCIDVHMIHSCQNRCSYCFIDFETGNKGQISNETLDNVAEKVEYLTSNPRFLNYYSGITIFFWGGEPTLHPKGIKRLIEKFKDNDRVAFFIYSNGQSIKNVIDLLEQYKNKFAGNGRPKVTIQISYDGIASHDKSRLTSTGKKTALKVKEVIYMLNEKQIPYTTKATLGWNDLNCIYDNYMEYRRMNDHFNGRIGLYCPTLDYSKSPDFSKEQIQNILNTLTEQFKKIAKMEMEYYEQHNEFFFSWLNPSKAICAAGSDMACVSREGKVLVCHGALYSPDSSIHQVNDLSLDNSKFLDNIINNKNNYRKSAQTLPKGCQNCFTHYCMKCNVVKADNSKKTDIFDRWNDYNNDEVQCLVYKHIGKLRLALMQIIEKKKLKDVK